MQRAAPPQQPNVTQRSTVRDAWFEELEEVETINSRRILHKSWHEHRHKHQHFITHHHHYWPDKRKQPKVCNRISQRSRIADALETLRAWEEAFPSEDDEPTNDGEKEYLDRELAEYSPPETPDRGPVTKAEDVHAWRCYFEAQVAIRRTHTEHGTKEATSKARERIKALAKALGTKRPIEGTTRALSAVVARKTQENVFPSDIDAQLWYGATPDTFRKYNNTM